MTVQAKDALINLMPQFNQKGALPLPILVAGIIIVAFLTITSVAPLKNNLLSSLFPKPASQAASSDWNEVSQLSSSGGFYVDVAVNGSTVHAIYGNGSISYRRSTDDGNSWGSPVSLGSGSVYLTDMIAATGTSVYAFYLSNLQGFSDNCCPRTGGDIFFKRSTNSGSSWGSQVQLTTSGRAFRVSSASDGSNVYVSWMDFRSGSWDIYYRR